ncbi:hypothetical protein BDP27DRAFT_1425564 [Rhodocollybia butyracea]|uniref:Uncharacterized protein n=1 Tax=Rhodocollybia butyracea TaxID=206335 RepID=A0A9P5PIX2_9AGAR|nr:hypothetical protein BDP27DRAFT_1425564 [Rhodocollybia butyracea]
MSQATRQSYGCCRPTAAEVAVGTLPLKFKGSGPSLPSTLQQMPPLHPHLLHRLHRLSTSAIAFNRSSISAELRAVRSSASRAWAHPKKPERPVLCQPRWLLVSALDAFGGVDPNGEGKEENEAKAATP